MKETRKPDAAREKRFRALVMGEFRPEFKRAIAIAVRRALRQERQKQRAAQPEAEAAALRRSVHDALLRAQQASSSQPAHPTAAFTWPIWPSPHS